jgi:hypothetical protein
MTATLLTNARLIDPEAGAVARGRAPPRGRRHRAPLRRSAAIREPCGLHPRSGRPLPRPRHRRHRREGVRTGRAPQGKLPLRRPRRRRGRRDHDGHPPRHLPRHRQPRDARVRHAPRDGGRPGPRPPDGRPHEGQAGPRDGRDRLPDGRGRGGLHRLRPRRDRHQGREPLLHLRPAARRAHHRPPAGPGPVRRRLRHLGQVRLPPRPAVGQPDGRAHGPRPRPRARRDDGRALPRRPDHHRPRAPPPRPRQGRGARHHRGRVDPPPHAQRTRRRRLPHLLQGEAPAPVRGRPHGGGRSRGRGADRRHLLHAHAPGRGIEAPALRGGRLRRRGARDASSPPPSASTTRRPRPADALPRDVAQPSRRLGLPTGRLAEGAPADLVAFDPDAPFVLDRFALRSKSKNTPFDGQRMQGRVRATWVAGSRVFGD